MKQVGRSLANGVLAIEDCDFVVDRAVWPWAEALGAEIDAHWLQALAANPHYFNGTIFLLHDAVAADGRLAGRFTKTNFATFLYWSAHAAAVPSIRNCSACTVLRSSDGAVLLGAAADGTWTAGKTLFFGGFFDQRDVARDGRIQPLASAARELREETGLLAADLRRTPGYIVCTTDVSMSIAVELVSPRPAVELRAQVMEYLSAQCRPELSDIVVVHGMADICGATMPWFVRQTLGHLLRDSI